MQQMMGVFESSYDFIQEENMREIIQLVVSFTGSLGFAALFNIHGKKLWFAAVGGCLSWAVYLAVEFITPSPYACGFWSTVAITLYAECMARIPERRNLYDPFCSEHGSRNDADNYCVPDGVAVDVQAEENVIQYRNSPFTNHQKCVTIFPYGKLVEEESTCVHHTTGKSPENFLYKEFRD